MTLETQLFSIENASTHANVFNSVKGANQVINKLNEGINVEEIDKLQADMEEQQQLQEEIAEALSQPIGFMANQDEDELLNELDQMEAEEFEKETLAKLEGSQVPIGNLNKQAVVQQQPQEQKQNQEMQDLMNDFMS